MQSYLRVRSPQRCKRFDTDCWLEFILDDWVWEEVRAWVSMIFIFLLYIYNWAPWNGHQVVDLFLLRIDVAGLFLGHLTCFELMLIIWNWSSSSRLLEACFPRSIDRVLSCGIFKFLLVLVVGVNMWVLPVNPPLWQDLLMLYHTRFIYVLANLASLNGSVLHESIIRWTSHDIIFLSLNCSFGLGLLQAIFQFNERLEELVSFNLDSWGLLEL